MKHAFLLAKPTPKWQSAAIIIKLIRLFAHLAFIFTMCKSSDKARSWYLCGLF
jgi:hypothetical protein